MVQEGSWCHYNPKSLSLQEHERVQRTQFMAASLMIRYSIFCTKLTFCPEGGARGKPMKCPKWKWSILWGAWLYHVNFMTYILMFPVGEVTKESLLLTLLNVNNGSACMDSLVVKNPLRIITNSAVPLHSGAFWHLSAHSFGFTTCSLKW